MADISAIAETAQPDGRLGDNIVYFCRTLRKAGMKIGPASVVEAIEAVEVGGLESREQFYWTLHAVLVKKREDRLVFDEAFRVYWRSRELVEKMLAMLSPRVAEKGEKPKAKPAENRVSDALNDAQKQEPPHVPQIEIEARLTPTGREFLREKDFAQMSAQELSDAFQAIAQMRLPDDRIETRRWQSGAPRGRFDPQMTMRHSLRGGGDLILPQWRQKRIVQPPLVIIADISGSMSQYSRIFLHFMHSLRAQSQKKQRRVHSFVFGTRLTNLSHVLNQRDPDEALDMAANLVQDWSGGTRIGEVLEIFNRTWSRRVLGQGATVLLMTDGLERDDAELLAEQTERLQKSCRKLIWLNPLLRFDGFEARATGVRAMLPFVHEFRAVHSLNALSDLCRALSLPETQLKKPQDWLHAAELPQRIEARF